MAGGKGSTFYLHVVVISSNFTCNGCAYRQRWRDSSVGHVKLLIIRETATCLQHMKQAWEITWILCTCSGLGCAVSRANSLWNVYLWVHRGSFEWQGGKQEGRKVSLTSILGILVWAVRNSVISPAWLPHITAWFLQCRYCLTLYHVHQYENWSFSLYNYLHLYRCTCANHFFILFIYVPYFFIIIGPSSLWSDSPMG